MLATPQTNAVPGLSDPRWQAVFARLLVTEGGFVDSPADHGGATKYGLSLRYLAQQARITPGLLAELDINRDGQLDLPDIKDLTTAEAASIYYRFFWTAPGCSTLPQPLDAAVFDQVVNDGQVPAIKLLQQAVNFLGARPVLVVDGALGAETRAGLNLVLAKAGAVATLDAYRAQAAGRYRDIVRRDPTQGQFLTGWLNRAAELGDV